MTKDTEMSSQMRGDQFRVWSTEYLLPRIYSTQSTPVLFLGNPRTEELRDNLETKQQPSDTWILFTNPKALGTSFGCLV